MTGILQSLNYRFKLDISKREKLEKFPNIWKLNNILQNNPLVKEKIIREI